ncbi:gastric triacylglycerol lipase-like [Macrobrachium nipponense]|uniref:gastric triacylglycerol lipase-like n=1 Tax=Macrobrachium nipponense TaxID=159736 RepID=UPI0030C80C89
MAVQLKVLATTVLSIVLLHVSLSEDVEGFRERRAPKIHPHTLLPTPGLIRARGYPAEVHHVATEDGYILELHRIPFSPRRSLGGNPNPINLSQNNVKRSLQLQLLNATAGFQHRSSLIGNSLDPKEPKVVFIQHCVLCSSADFVMNDPNQALAFILSDAGYDVWLGNIRGNIYSRRHRTITAKNPKFWEFSWDTCARYDIPSMLQYVRTNTGANQVSYIGHSMGTTMFFAMMNIHPHINSWVRVMAAMAPVAYMHNKHAPIGVLSPVINGIDRSLTRSGMAGVSNANKIYINANLWVMLRDALHPVYLQVHNYLPVIVAHTPAGTSFRTVTHLLQLVRDRRFQAFDYGPTDNIKVYGTTKPPRLDLAAVTVPVGAFWSDNDWIADPRDVQQTVRELGNVVLNHRVQHNNFNHLDFLWAENAADLVYRHILDLLDRYN